MRDIQPQNTFNVDFPAIEISLFDLNPRERVPDAVDAWLSGLALKAQLGDRSARNTIFEVLRPRFAPIFWRIRASSLWRDHEGRSWTFEDLEQESFLIFCELIGSWRGGDSGIVGYIFSCLPWRLRDVLRKWTAPNKHEAPSLPIGLPADDVIDQTEFRMALESVFSQLTSDLAVVLRLRLFHGLRDEEIAALLGVNVRTVRRRRHAAYRQARAIYLGGNDGG